MLSPLRVSVLACAATAVMLAGVAAGGFGPGEAIERSYGRAFDALEEMQASRSPAGAIDPAHIHLSRLPEGTSSPLLGAPGLGVGDVITLAARNGGSIAYEVIEVRPLVSQGGVVAPASPAGLMMVTAVAKQPVAQTIRFIVDADNPADALPTLQPRAL